MIWNKISHSQQLEKCKKKYLRKNLNYARAMLFKTINSTVKRLAVNLGSGDYIF